MHHASRRAVRAALLAGAAGALTLPIVALAATANVQAGGGVQAIQADMDAYYPNRITIHAGDSVKWALKGFHTVTFAPTGKAAPPLVLPAGPAPSTNDPGGAPYWWAGQTQLAFNPAALAPTRSTVVTGRTLVNSGAPGGRNPTFTATFPKPGTYTYVCAVHANMRGVVRVLPRTAHAPGLAAQVATGRRQLAADAAASKAAAAAPSLALNTVLVGKGTVRFSILKMLPDTITVKAGTTVDFQWGGREEAHTVTFGPEPYLDALAKQFEQAQGVLPPEVTFPSDPPTGGPAVLTSTTHGTGVVNSGLLFDPTAGPGAHAFQVRFDVPGTYHYMCMVHGKMMSGTVVVTA